MNAFETTNRFLVKFRDPSAAASPRISVRLGRGRPAVTFASKPLFHSIGIARAPGLAASGGAWRVATASARLGETPKPGTIATTFSRPIRAWSRSNRTLCSDGRLVRTMRGRSSGPAPEGRIRKTSEAATAGVADDNYWFRDSTHNQMESAFAQTSGGAGVRIAHLDPATTRPTNRFPNTCARISRIISSTPTSRTMRRIGRREHSTISAALRHAQHSGRRNRAEPQAVRLRAERRDRPSSGRQPGRAVQQQHDRRSTTSTACADRMGRASMS